MRLTSMDILNKEFKKSFRGFDSDEVEEFLEKVAEDYEALYKENSTFKEKLGNMNEKLEHYSRIESTIQNTLLLAQNASEQAKASAQKEAELIVKNANDTSQRLLDKAHKDIQVIHEEYDRLKNEFMKFRVKFKTFIKAQMETFEGMEKDFDRHYNIGNVLNEAVKVKEYEDDEGFKVKNIDDESFKGDDLNDIKSFFVKES
jgi:cell division initiation protein